MLSYVYHFQPFQIHCWMKAAQCRQQHCPKFHTATMHFTRKPPPDTFPVSYGLRRTSCDALYWPEANARNTFQRTLIYFLFFWNVRLQRRSLPDLCFLSASTQMYRPLPRVSLFCPPPPVEFSGNDLHWGGGQQHFF